MNLSNPFWPKHTFKFKGGSSGAAAQQTVVSTPPPPTTQSVEIQQAQRDTAKQNAKRKGINNTILAGETGDQGTGGLLGGYAAGNTQQRKATLLGGG